MNVFLKDFSAHDVDRIEPWFDDPETQKWLGGRDWIRREPSLLALTIGDEFRGKVVTGRWMWLSVDDADAPLAFVDAETYDRYAAWDGSDWDHPLVSDVLERPAMGLTIVVNPSRRRRGVGTATLRAVMAHPAAAPIGVFFGSVEMDNLASIRCLEKAGFTLRSDRPDFEGMLHYSLER